jgi:lipopolysaccharide biosynthesis regulator YciM
MEAFATYNSILAVFFGVVAVLAAIGWFMKRGQAQRLDGEAAAALARGDDAAAVKLHKQALWAHNESPEEELRILSVLAELYARNGKSGELENYRKLIEQYRTLSKRSAPLTEIIAVQGLKEKLLATLPELASATPPTDAQNAPPS